MRFINGTKKIKKGKGFVEVPIKLVCINEPTKLYVECDPNITEEEYQRLKQRHGF